MNKMTGVILMVVGALVLGIGIVVYSTGSKDKVKEIHEDVAEKTVVDSNLDDSDINYQNGLDFEKFIVKKFTKKLYKIKEWAGDKYVEGVYAEANQHPDLLMEFNGYNQKKEFAVECKWRHKLYNNGIAFSTQEQLNRYKDYAKKKNIPVFIAIGLGGKGATPEKLFIVPLSDISKPFMLINQLKKYDKNVDANFYYDYEKEELK